jgi:hypothetical protein
VGKHTDELGTIENFKAPWESDTGPDQEIEPAKLKKLLFNFRLDRAKAQDARDEAGEKVTSLETELQQAKADVAKGDPTGKIADLETKLRTATENLAKANLDKDRIEIGIEKGLTPKQAKRLQGTTKEELEADAEELLETFGVTAKQNETDEEREEREEREAEEADDLRRTPRTPLNNPADPKNGAEQEPDYEKIADQIARSGRII